MPPPAPNGPPSPATPTACSGCAVSPDGTWIVSASDDGTLKIWDAATGAERATFSGHTGDGARLCGEPRRRLDRLRQLTTTP